MPDALTVAQRYFALSNISDMPAIEEMMTHSTTYSSPNTGVYLGKTPIMQMQRAFHSSFDSLKWNVVSVSEVSPGVVLFDFVFEGTSKAGETITRSGDEYVIVFDGKLQHIEVRNK